MFALKNCGVFSYGLISLMGSTTWILRTNSDNLRDFTGHIYIYTINPSTVVGISLRIKLYSTCHVLPLFQAG